MKLFCKNKYNAEVKVIFLQILQQLNYKYYLNMDEISGDVHKGYFKKEIVYCYININSI